MALSWLASALDTIQTANVHRSPEKCPKSRLFAKLPVTPFFTHTIGIFSFSVSNKHMRWFLSLFLLGACGAACSQPARSDLHRVEHFEILDRSRLVALAKLGAATKTSLLVEGGDIRFLEQSITLSADRQTLDELILKILRGREHYATTHRGVLIVAYPKRPSKPINRILKLPL